MIIFQRVCLSVALAVIPIAAHAIYPAACQTSPTRRQPSSLGAADSLGAAEGKSVLGIEVRTSVQKNIGRVVDVLVDESGRVEAAVIEFGGFLGIGTRKIAIEWSALRFETEGKQVVAILEIPRDQLVAAPEYKPGQPVVVTRVVRPQLPAVKEPPHQIAKPGPPQKRAPSAKRKRQHRQDRD